MVGGARDVDERRKGVGGRECGNPEIVYPRARPGTTESGRCLFQKRSICCILSSSTLCPVDSASARHLPPSPGRASQRIDRSRAMATFIGRERELGTRACGRSISKGGNGAAQ